MATGDLFPEEEPTYRTFLTAEIEKLCPDIATGVLEPSHGLIQSVRTYGVLSPILVIENKGGKTYKCAAGRRRYRAAKITEREFIPARVFPYGWTVAAVLTLVENEHRSRNPLSEWLAIEELLKKYTVEEIVQRTGIAIQRVEKLKTLNNLHSDLLEGFKEGKIKAGPAMKAALQNPKVQARLAKVYQDKGRLTGEDIAEERRAVKASAVGALPGILFEDKPKDWRLRFKIQPAGNYRFTYRTETDSRLDLKKSGGRGFTFPGKVVSVRIAGKGRPYLRSQMKKIPEKSTENPIFRNDFLGDLVAEFEQVGRLCSAVNLKFVEGPGRKNRAAKNKLPGRRFNVPAARHPTTAAR